MSGLGLVRVLGFSLQVSWRDTMMVLIPECGSEDLTYLGKVS